jgi:hypothetical protein
VVEAGGCVQDYVCGVKCGLEASGPLQLHDMAEAALGFLGVVVQALTNCGTVKGYLDFCDRG